MSERDKIIQSARNADSDFDANALVLGHGPGPFERASDRQLAIALWALSNHSLADDTAATFQGHVAQIGCYLLFETDDGFKTVQTFANADAASLRVTELVEEFDRGGPVEESPNDPA